MDGIIITNKQKGYTSHDVVNKVKRIVKEKVGHTGTLDPLATGVLPILIGKGTLCSKYLINHDKEYEVSLKLGVATNTMDAEGKILEEKEVDSNILEKCNVEKVLASFVGKQEQEPPMYSAIKVAGKKLYEYARKGEKIDIKPRTIEIYSINLIKYLPEEKQIEFEVYCGKGTYIRSLCEDIASKLETIGYMKELKRIQVGNFKIEDSITIDELQKNINNNNFIEQKIISLEKIFEDKPKIKLSNKKIQLLLNGVKLTQNENDGIYRIYNQNDDFIGIGIINKKLLKRDIIEKEN